MNWNQWSRAAGVMAGEVAVALLALGFAGLGLAGCAQMEHLGWQYLTTTTKPALLQIGGQRLTGEVQLRPDRTGSALLRGEGDLESCAGSLRFTSVTGGAVDMRCSDGSVLDLSFTLLNEVKGYALGSYQGTRAVLSFGMDPAEAQAYLALAQSLPTNIDSKAGKPFSR